MFLPLEDKRKRLAPATLVFAGGATTFVRGPPGEGGFRFDRPTVGFVLTPQRRHEGRYGSDRTRPMPLGAGMGWVLPAGVDGWCAWDADTDFLNVALDSALFDKAGLSAGDLHVGAQVADPLMVQMAIALHENAAGSDGVGTLYRDALALSLAAHLARHFGAGPAEATPPPLDGRLQRVVDHIEAHLAEDLAIETLASVAALSPFHFAKSFKAATGLPPHKFVASRRVERAKALLKSTTLPVAEVAYRVGWENVSHFTQAFRAATGATPAAWRAGA